MTGPAKVARHPIHPMLVTLPIGLWVFSLVSDFIYLASGITSWNTTAFYCMAAGIVGALLAAIPGFMDYFAMRESPVKTIASKHMALNLVLVVLYAVNLWLRTLFAPYAALPLALSVIGVVLLCVSGWLGGEMVYVHGAGAEAAEMRPGVVTPMMQAPSAAEEQRRAA